MPKRFKPAFQPMKKGKHLQQQFTIDNVFNFNLRKLLDKLKS